MVKHIFTVLFVIGSLALSAQPTIDVDSKKMSELLPSFFFQSFNVSPITKEAFNSIGVCYTGEGKLVYVSDKPFVTFLLSITDTALLYLIWFRMKPAG